MKIYVIVVVVSSIFSLLLTAVVPARAQLPATDIWMADLRVDATGVQVGVPVNVTRRPGYDNQPAFLGDGGGFLYSAGDTTGTDIFRRDGDGTLIRLTRTPESEYSPTPLPGGAPGFCAVRVEADSTQRLWRFDADGGNPRVVMADVDSVGYFEWIDPARVAVFVVGEPHTLRIVDVASQRERIVARDIGRFLRCRPGTGDLAFALRNADDTYRFALLPAKAGEARPLIDGVGAGQDAAWAGDVLLASSATGIYACRPLTGGSWQQVADARDWGVPEVTRLAVRPDGRGIAIVCGE